MLLTNVALSVVPPCPFFINPNIYIYVRVPYSLLQSSQLSNTCLLLHDDQISIRIARSSRVWSETNGKAALNNKILSVKCSVTHPPVTPTPWSSCRS